MKQYCYYNNQLKGKNTRMALFSYETKKLDNGTTITDPRVHFLGVYFLDYKGISVADDKKHWSSIVNKYSFYYCKFDTIGIDTSNFVNKEAILFEAEDDEDAINQIKLLREIGEIQ